MPITLTAAAFTQYTAPDTCIGFPAWAAIRLTTNALALSALAGCQLHVYPEWWVQTGGSPPPPLDGPYLVGGSTYYSAARSGSFRLDIAASMTTATAYTLNYAHPADPTNEAARRPARATVTFDIVGGVVVADVALYWLNHADQHGFGPTPPQAGPKRLLRPEYTEPQDLGYRAGGHAYYQNASTSAKVMRVQALIVEDLAANLFSHLSAESAATALRFWGRETDGTPATGFHTPGFALYRGGQWQAGLSASAPSLMRVTAQGSAAPDRVYVGIFRTDAPNPAQFYGQATELAVVEAPLTAINPLFEATADAFDAPAVGPLTVSAGHYEAQLSIKANYPQLGGRYRAFAVWQLPTNQAYAFISDEWTVSPCPPLTPPDATGKLRNHHAEGTDWLHAAVLERVQSEVTFDAAAYDASRPSGLLAALQSLHAEVYFDETLGSGQTYRHTLAEGIALPQPSGLWDTSGLAGLSVNSDVINNLLTIDYTFRIRQDALLRCLRSRNLTTGVLAPQPLANQDWTGRSLRIVYTLTTRQTSPAEYTESLVKTQRVDVGPLLSPASVALTEPTAPFAPLAQICDDRTAAVRLCIEAPAAMPADADLLAVRGAVGLDSRLLTEHDPASGFLPQLNDHALSGLPATLTGQTACVELLPAVLPAAGANPQRLCLVLRGEACPLGALTFLGGPEGSASEFVEVPPSAVFDFAAGPFTVALWMRYTGTLPSSGSVFVSRRPTSGDFWYGWAVGISSAGVLSMTARDGAANLGNRSALAAAPPDQWLHVAFVFDGTNPADWRIYANGLPLATNAPVLMGSVASFDAPPATPAFPLRLGRDTALDTDDYLSGALMGVQLYDVALSAAQIAQLAQTAPCEPSALASLRAHYPLNHTSGTVASDIGPSALHGDLLNYDSARTASGGGAWVLP